MFKKWTADFKRGRDNIEDGPHSGRPAIAATLLSYQIRESRFEK